MTEVIDLDKLRPPEKFLKLGGNNIQYGFIPSGVAFEFIKLQEEFNKLSEDLKKNKDTDVEKAKRQFKLSAKMCSLLTENQYPEMTVDWLLANTSMDQLQRLIKIVTDAIFESMKYQEENEGKKGKREKKETEETGEKIKKNIKKLN